MSDCPACHEPLSADGGCYSCDWGPTGDSDGCYICQPDNPNADEEGCSACEVEFWRAALNLALALDGER
jgi:hypothetical protein